MSGGLKHLLDHSLCQVLPSSDDSSPPPVVEVATFKPRAHPCLDICGPIPIPAPVPSLAPIIVTPSPVVPYDVTSCDRACPFCDRTFTTGKGRYMLTNILRTPQMCGSRRGSKLPTELGVLFVKFLTRAGCLIIVQGLVLGFLMWSLLLK